MGNLETRRNEKKEWRKSRIGSALMENVPKEFRVRIDSAILSVNFPVNPIETFSLSSEHF